MWLVGEERIVKRKKKSNMQVWGIVLVVLGVIGIIGFIFGQSNDIEVSARQISLLIGILGAGIYLIQRAEKNKQEYEEKEKGERIFSRPTAMPKPASFLT